MRAYLAHRTPAHLDSRAPALSRTLILICLLAACGSPEPAAEAKTDSVPVARTNRLEAGAHTARTAEKEITDAQNAAVARMEAEAAAARDSVPTP
jgi:hypothetical protein